MKQDESIEDNLKTVVFRTNRERTFVLALFPKVPGHLKSGECSAFKCTHPKFISFPKPNKWGSIPYEEAIANTFPATEREYAPVIELISALGHKLIVMRHEDLVPSNFQSVAI